MGKEGGDAVADMLAAAKVGARGWYTGPGMVAPSVVNHAAGDEDDILFTIVWFCRCYSSGFRLLAELVLIQS
jgi:hypothetical protein